MTRAREDRLRVCWSQGVIILCICCFLKVEMNFNLQSTRSLNFPLPPFAGRPSSTWSGVNALRAWPEAIFIKMRSTTSDLLRLLLFLRAQCVSEYTIRIYIYAIKECSHSLFYLFTSPTGHASGDASIYVGRRD
jgi:hypothetical protein